MKTLVFAIIILQLSAIACHTQSGGTSGAAVAPFRAIHLPVATHPTMPTIADVNRDGNLDILVATGDGGVTLYLGDGKGGFTEASGSPFPAGQNCADIATADFNGDGNLDVAIANQELSS